MAEPHVLGGRSSSHDPAPTGQGKGPLLEPRNARGFRLVMLADAFALAAIMVGAMMWRYGLPPWPSYDLSLYVLSFTISAVIFMGSLYFGGLYDRDPRLGAPPALPRAGRQTLAAGGLIALLTLVLTGLAREVGITAERALPFPIANLVATIVIGAKSFSGSHDSLRRCGWMAWPLVVCRIV
jgi:hypothetical protein